MVNVGTECDVDLAFDRVDVLRDEIESCIDAFLQCDAHFFSR